MSPGKATRPSGKARPVRVLDRTLDARPDRLDLRDLPYRAPLRSLPSHFPTNEQLNALLPGYVAAGLILDQGSEGACTGFGLACVVNHMLWRRHVQLKAKGDFDGASPRMLYELAKRYDEWPGESYSGSSCRGAVKGWHKHGVCAAGLWPYVVDAKGMAEFQPPLEGWEADGLRRTIGVYYRVDRSSIVDMQAALYEIGAVYVSASVHNGWDVLMQDGRTKAPRSHAEVPDIAPIRRRGDSLSGHAFALVGYDEHGFIVQNSWGEAWGAGGFGRLSYAEWIENGTDAWVCALGVPASAEKAVLAGVRWRQPSGRSLTSLTRPSASRSDLASDPWPIQHDFLNKAYEPISTADAYSRSLVTGNDGEVSVRDITLGGPAAQAASVRDLAYERPRQWFASQTKGAPARLAIYAHGGLNDEDTSIERVRVLAPYFIANGVYPLFLVWRTGVAETIRSLLEDWIRRIPGVGAELSSGLVESLSEKKDRAMEVIARPLGSGIWGEMKENADRSMQTGHGMDLLAEQLWLLGEELAAKGRPLEVHLLGHSAGAILLGHLLEEITLRKGSKPLSFTVGACSLMAPACSVRFANERYVAASNAGVLDLSRLWLYCLDDANEKRDALPSPAVPLYGKSLLYLVSRALDVHHKEPILGLEYAHLKAYATDRKQWASEEFGSLREWQETWRASKGSAARTVVVRSESVRTTRTGAQVQATHGSFDNNIEILTEIIERARGRSLVSAMEWLDY